MKARFARLTRTTIPALLACVALVGGTAVATTSAANAAPTTFRFNGTVSDRAGFPLAGVEVQVVRADHEDSDIEPVITGRKGDFVTPAFVVQPDVKYQLVATDPTGRHLTAYSKGFAPTAANRTQNLTMGPAAVIRGKITTKKGDTVRPGAGIFVEAYGTTPGGKPAGGAEFASALGAFSMGGLPSGTYRLVFSDYDEEGNYPDGQFSPICYDNVPVTSTGPDECEGQTFVTVKAGTVTTLHPQVLDELVE